MVNTDERHECEKGLTLRSEYCYWKAVKGDKNETNS
jgi:hypothetical protein